MVRSANICYCVLFAMIWHYMFSFVYLPVYAILYDEYLLLSTTVCSYHLLWTELVLYGAIKNIGYHLAANICHSFPLSNITWYRLLSFDLIYYQLILLSARIYYYLVSCGTLNYYLQLLVLSAVTCYYLLDLLLSAIVEYDLLLSAVICYNLQLSAIATGYYLPLSTIMWYYLLLYVVSLYYVPLPIIIRLWSAMICCYLPLYASFCW